MVKTNPIFTIGHSTHTVETFLALLRLHDVGVVADVRSSPYSRFTPQFNREALERILKQHNLKYMFFGSELGARSEDISCYKDGRIQYNRLAATDLFLSGIERIKKGAETHRIALMCAEKEPLDCHRTLLVARVLFERGMIVKHILENSSLEDHETTMERLLDFVGVPHVDLFRSKQELVSEALSRQEKRIAFVDKQMVDEFKKEVL